MSFVQLCAFKIYMRFIFIIHFKFSLRVKLPTLAGRCDLYCITYVCALLVFWQMALVILCSL